MWINRRGGQGRGIRAREKQILACKLLKGQRKKNKEKRRKRRKKLGGEAVDKGPDRTYKRQGSMKTKRGHETDRRNQY
jgi:hypothetical protein